MVDNSKFNLVFDFNRFFGQQFYLKNILILYSIIKFLFSRKKLGPLGPDSLLDHPLRQ